MLAFLFWHRPSRRVAQCDYETALTAYHRSLVGMPSPGFQRSLSVGLDAVPWLDGRDGYEDWYLVDSSAALDPLNEAGVAPERWALHGAVASLMAVGHGGLYAHLSGDAVPPTSGTSIWLSRPRGIDFDAPLQAICDAASEPFGVWRKQLVLGPAPEFLMVGPGLTPPPLPEGWQATTLARRALGPN